MWDDKPSQMLRKVRAACRQKNKASDPLFEKAYQAWEAEYLRKKEAIVFGRLVQLIPEGRLLDLAIQVHVSRVEEYYRGELYDEARRRSASASLLFNRESMEALGVRDEDEAYIDPVKEGVFVLDQNLEHLYFSKVIGFLRDLSRRDSDEDIQNVVRGVIPDALKAIPEISEFTASVAKFIWEYRENGGAELVRDICESHELARLVFLVTEPDFGYSLRSLAGWVLSLQDNNEDHPVGASH